MKNLFIALGLTLFLNACKQEVIETDAAPSSKPPVVLTAAGVTAVAENQTVLLSGDFSSDAHTTVGKVRILEDKDKKKSLILENFKTDAGPDLRIYLAEDKKSTGFIEITSTVKNGNVSIELPTNIDLKKQTYVLIWCKQYTVLFGSANLK